jgi:hypothetical protein
MKSTHADVFKILINKKYGGFGFSTRAIELYKLRNPNTEYSGSRNLRTDIEMIKIVEELGPLANSEFSSLCVETIPAIYKNHWNISEYDGMENIVIKYDRYKLDEVARIVNDNEISDELKVKQLKSLIINER